MVRRNLPTIFVFDIAIFSVTPLLALILRLDGSLVVEPYVSDLAIATFLFVVIKLSVFWSFGFYRRYWRYASIEELMYVGVLTAAAVVIQTIGFDIFRYSLPGAVNAIPRSLPFIDGLLSFVFIGGSRFSFRLIERIKQRRTVDCSHERVLIVGAGSAGVALVQEMQRSPQLGLYPVAFIDDDPQKLNLRMRGIHVVGDRNSIPSAVRSLHVCKVIIAMPTVAGEIIREIVDICSLHGVQTRTLPGIHEILNGRVRVESIRDVRIEDLLRREPVQTDIESVSQFIKGKRVLITGAGGSIGSELCRQILSLCPSEILIVGHGENSVFNIQQELEQVVQVLRDEAQTLLIILLVGLAKAFESISDVLYGLIQQHERMDRIATSLMIKGPLSLLFLGIGVYLSGSLTWGVAGLAIAWAIVLIGYDVRSGILMTGKMLQPRWNPSTLKKLVWLALPLGFVMMLGSLYFNIPRYFIERYLGERELGIFASIAYLMVAGNMVVNALGESASPRLAKYYASGDAKAFCSLLLKLVGIAVLLGGIAYFI